jgi:transposase-like protein
LDWIGPLLRYLKTKKVNTIVSVQAVLEINGPISIIDLSRRLDQTNLNNEILQTILSKHQDNLVNQLCGKKYSRDKNRQYKRAGTAKRTLQTRHGEIKLRLIKVRSLENNTIFKPLLLDLGVEPRRRIVDDLVFESAEVATLLTYRDAVTVIESLTKAETSKHRVHRYVQEVGSHMNVERRKCIPDRVGIMLGDGTKTHGLGEKKNEVNVVLGRDPETGAKHLLAVEVNKNWPETALHVHTEADVLVCDADKAMRNALRGRVLSYQLCVNHAVRQAGNHLWRAGVPKARRRSILNKLVTILRVLRFSVRKHLLDKDFGRLRWRIDWTLSELRKLASELVDAGSVGAGKFIRQSANYLVTYARLAVKGERIPYTNNLIERLMGEVAKRVKNRWMHWSTVGLENMLNILLVRYCDKRLYSSLKEKYYKIEDVTIEVKIT